MLLGLYLFLVIALPLALGLLVALNGLPRTRLCPLCTGETIRIRSRRHAALSRFLPRESLQRRWCPCCDWSGTVRVARRPAGARGAPRAPVGPRETASAADGPVPPAPGLQVRCLELDDGAWRVQLECWAEEGAWRGRLLFVGPGGHAWTDGRPHLVGRSAVEVFSQVLSLSDRALVGRIRKATR
ncbi:MAG: hypothetical protein KY466_12575 [Gemmatimonadetes bacterium]|nr:hypothetical protein [Gemmatimonadota bacterium]